MALVDPVAVRSEDFDHIYMVAARADGEPALWVMNQLDGGGLIFSVNDHAHSVSPMGHSAEEMPDPITEDDDGASEALSCVSPA